MNSRITTDISRRHYKLAPPRQTQVCAYIRVSTSHDAQLNSFNNQIDYYNRKFSNSPHYCFVGVFSDAGISGVKVNRPGFDAMLEKAKSGEIDLIYTKSVSRFARNTLMLLEAVRELKAIGVGVVFEEQNINTLSSEGELMLTVLAGVAEEERKSVQSNVQWAMRKKFLRGEVMVDTNRLLGYGKDKSGSLVVIPEQAEIILKIFRMYLDGLSAYRVAQILNDENIPTYSNRLWRDHRILNIISNEKYAGSCLMQKSFIDESGHQVRNRGERDKYWVEDSHPAIISQSDWDKAQLIRKSHAKKIYPYTSLLRCAHCGSTLIRVVQSRRWVSWICYRYMQQGKSACPGSRIPEARLLELTKEHPITEPVVVKEVTDEQQPNKRHQKNYYFIPVSEFTEVK